MPKVKHLRPIFQYKKSEKETLTEITMVINIFHGKQDYISKIYEFYNRIKTWVLTNNGIFRVVWFSQGNGGQNMRMSVKIASKMEKDLIGHKKTHFHSHYVSNAF